MSDRVSNAEVEDVLSSIRRLVSEDHRGAKARPKPPEAAADEAQASDRLVLTPALRIMTPPADEAPQADTDVSDEVKAEVQPEAEVDEVESAPKSNLSIDSLVTDDVPFDPFTHRIDAEEDDDLANDDSHLATHPSVAEESSKQEDEQTEIVEVATQSVEANEVVSDIASAATDADADVSTVSATVDLDIPANEFEEVTEDDASENADNEDSAPQEAASPDVKAAALGAKIAALETAIGKISDTWEPDDAGESDYAGTQPDVMDWEDEKPEPEAAPFGRPMLAPVMQMPKDPEPETIDEDEVEAEEAKPVAQPFMSKRTNPSKPLNNRVEEPEIEEEEQPIAAMAAAEPAAETPAAEELPSEGPIATARVTEDEQLIDEEALRDLVSDIVRAELQGPLGERITRNVRKLVRREIHRALVAQELE